MKVILIPGNGGVMMEDHWFPYIKRELEKLGLEVIAENFPDPDLAREKYWLPFIKKLGADKDTILIGHSSGAEAAMRFAETHQILGSVLVGACYTDLGEESEKIAGYYNRPWIWKKIKNNQKWIIQFHSTDDPYIPIEEARDVHKNLKTEYSEFNNKGHFMIEKFPELVQEIRKQISMSE